MKIGWLALIAVLLLTGAAGIKLYAHCQIPCGIYDDPARFTLLEEHVTTIEKSVKEITKLSATESPDWNQITRWVKNKEHHADEFSHIVTYYFLAQRIKPVDPENKDRYAKYLNELVWLHEMVVYSMKAKQTIDLGNVAKLRSLIKGFKASYLGK